jgi:hypothetical protein
MNFAALRCPFVAAQYIYERSPCYLFASSWQTPPIKFIRVDVKGAVGQIFNGMVDRKQAFLLTYLLGSKVFHADFGPGFTVLDTNGENPHAGSMIWTYMFTRKMINVGIRAGVVAHITNTNPAIVTVPNDEQVHIHIGGRLQ